MKLNSRAYALSIALVLSPVLLTGCSSSFAPAADVAGESSIGTLQGNVHGGRQAIVGGHVYLYVASTTGYGGASTSLLKSVPGVTTADASGHYYVTTGTGGSFTLNGTYTCTAGTQLYLYSVGGDPGSGTPNPAAGLMAALGTCPSTGTLAAQVPYVVVNELSTIVTAYALAGFAVDPTHVGSSGTALAVTGLANAIAQVPNLTSVADGAARATTPAGNGTVPVAKINHLANVLVNCINSSNTLATPSTACNNLFSLATSTGTSTGTKPTDTAAAAINIAHFPAANVNALWAATGTIAPFSTGLASAPNDWTLAVPYTGNGLGMNPRLAVDAAGNIWTTPKGSGVVTQMSSTGVVMSGANGYTPGSANALDIAITTGGSAMVLGSANGTGTLTTISSGGKSSTVTPLTAALLSAAPMPSTGTSLALDGSSDAYFVNSSSSLTRVAAGSSTGTTSTLLLGSSGITAGQNGVAIDNSGNVWVSSSNNQLSKFAFGGQLLSASGNYQGGGLNSPFGLALDNSSNVIVSNTGGNSLSAFSSTGTAYYTNGYTNSSLVTPLSLTADGLAEFFVATSTGVAKFSEATQTAISGNNGFQDSSLNTPSAVVVDGAGNVWVGNKGSATLTQFIGLAAPVMTPLAAGASAGKLATRP